MLNYSRHYRAINGRQVAVEEKRGVSLGRLARLPIPKIAVTHGGPSLRCTLLTVPDVSPLQFPVLDYIPDIRKSPE